MSTTSSEAPSAIRVLVRVRPLNDKEARTKNILELSSDNESGESSIDFNNNNNKESGGNASTSTSSSQGTVSIVTNDLQPPGQQQSFTYDAVFGTNSEQIDIFESVKGIVDAVVSGYNGTIVAYGQTGSGKTFTIFGNEDNGSVDGGDEDAGLVQRSLKEIFEKMNNSNNNNNSSATSTSEYTAKASFFEIYNEKVYDLLSSNDNMLQESLPVREDSSSKKGVYVEGLLEQEVTNTLDVMDVLRVGNDNRRVAATSMNRVSSRSHAVFVLTVKNVVTNNNDGTTKVLESKFTLVDLAGSERQKSTDAAGERLKEASMINNSLLCLGNVINSLVDREQGKERHVPFRDSKLTFLLRDSWGGNSKTCLVATVTPSAASIAETISTLKFAQRAKLIKNTAVKNETYSVAALQMEIARLKGELEQRNNNNNNSNGIISDVASSSLSSFGMSSSNSNTSDHIIVSSLRNHNARLSNDLKVVKDSAGLMEMQVNALKRKLQQEIMIRKCKERRIVFLSKKSSSEGQGDENEEISNLQVEVQTLRAQLETKQNPESIQWMIKYKEEKSRLEQFQNLHATALNEANDTAELEAHLDSLLNDKEALEQQLASIQSGRNNEMELQKQIDVLQSQLSKKEADVLQSEAEVKATKSQVRLLDKDRTEALEILETVNSELLVEKKKVVELQASLDQMKQLMQEKDAMGEKQQVQGAAQQKELIDVKAQVQSLQKTVDAAKEENCSLMKSLNDATNDLSAKEEEIVNIKSEYEQALAGFSLKAKEGSDELESFQAQLTEKEAQLTSLLNEKSELDEKNVSLVTEVNGLKKTNAEYQERVDSLEDELVCISQEKKQADEELNFVREDLKRTVAHQEECNAKLHKTYENDLVQRDEVIISLRSENESLQQKFDDLRQQLTDNDKRVEALQKEMKAKTEECDAMEKKEQNLLSTLDTLTTGYDQLREENDVMEKELKKTKSLLEKSTSMNEELKRSSDTKMSETEAMKAEFDALEKEKQLLLSQVENATDKCTQLQTEKDSVEEDLIATKGLQEELERKNNSMAVEVDALKGEVEAAKEKEHHLASELEALKSDSSQLQLAKAAAEQELLETKTLLESSASANEELEQNVSSKTTEMEELRDQVLRLKEESEARKVLESQVTDLTGQNESLQADLDKLQARLVASESAKTELDEINAAKMEEKEAELAQLKTEHSTEVDKWKHEAESVKTEMLEKEEASAENRKEMEALVVSLKDEHAAEIERLTNEAEMLKANAMQKEERADASLNDAKELVSKLKSEHAKEIEQLQEAAKVANTKAVDRDEVATKKLSEMEAMLASLRDEHTSEIKMLKQEVEVAKAEVLGKEEESCAKLKEMEAEVAILKDQHVKEIEKLNNEAEALKAEMVDKDNTSSTKLSEMEAAVANLRNQHSAEIKNLNNEAEAAREESSAKVKELEILIENMKDQHATEVEKLKVEVEELKAEAPEKVGSNNESAEPEGDHQVETKQDFTFDDEDDFDESMFLPNVGVQPDESTPNHDELSTVDPSEPVVNSVDTAPTIAVEKVDENSPLSSSAMQLPEANGNHPNQNAEDKSSPKKPAARRSRRTTKADQTEVRVTRRSTRSSRTPFEDLTH